MEKLRLREVHKFLQAHTARESVPASFSIVLLLIIVILLIIIANMFIHKGQKMTLLVFDVYFSHS